MLGALFGGSEAIYEKNKGINDWHIEHLGELQDLKFVESLEDNTLPNLVYSITENGVLSLFNVDTQTFEWKKKVVSKDSDEKFQLSYLARNLLIHSQNRGMLINT